MKFTVQVYRREGKLFKTQAPKPEKWVVMAKGLEEFDTELEAVGRAEELRVRGIEEGPEQ